MHNKLISTLALLGLANLVWAEGSAVDDAASGIEEIVVEASRTGMTVMDMSVNTSILDQQDIEESMHKGVDEILRQIPGFSMLRAADSTAASLTTNTVSLRGLGGNAASRTLVMLDGIPIHNPYSSEVIWSRVPKHQIERIEVVRGGGVNSWGNLSLGGVINIVTARPREKGIDFSGIISDPKTIDLSLAGSHIIDRWSFSGSLGYYDTDGYQNTPDEQRGPIDENVRNDFKLATAKAIYEFSDNASFYMNGSYSDEYRNGGSPQDVDLVGTWGVGTGLDLDTAGDSHWALSLFYDESDLDSTSVRIDSSRDSESIRAHRLQPTSALGTSLVWSRDLGNGHSISAGADYRWTDIDIDEFSRYSGDTPRNLNTWVASQDLGGLFIQDTWQLNDAWQLNGSVRYDYVSNQGEKVTTDLTTGSIVASETFDKNSETTTNPSLGIRYQATDVISLRAAAYKGFRAATLRELYRSASIRGGTILVNNPELRPERMTGIEAGADFLFDSNVTLRITVFQNTVENLIQNITRGVAGGLPEVIEPCGLIDAGETCRELDNVGEMEAKGLELDLQYEPSEHWSFFLSYLYNDSEVTSAPGNPQIVGNQIRQAPKNSLTARVRNSNSWFDTSLMGRYVGERFEDDLNSLPVDDFFLLDLRLSRQVSDSTEVFLTIDNLLDTEYEVRTASNGDMELGRPRFVGLGVRFRH